MAKYFDKREGREKTVPNCVRHGLVWNEISQRCEKISGPGYMAEDFYQDDYLLDGGGGGYYDGGGGGGIDYGFDTTSWPTFEEYYGSGGLPPDYAPGFGPETGFMDLGGGYLYDPSTGDILDTGLWQQGFDTGQTGGSDLWQQSFENWLGTGLDEATAASYADQDVEAIRASQGAINISQSATELSRPPTLPEIPAPADTYFPYYPYNYWETPPYIPPFEPPAPPPLLPPYCPVGTYHPYPIGHPQQDVCAPFPAAMTRQQRPGPAAPTRPPSQPPAPAPRPSGQQPTQRPRPPAQQQQRCQPPLVFDQATGRCVPQGQAISPLPIPTEATDMFADLKKLPWWVWVAGAGLLLLGMGGEERKSVTIRHRRAD